MSTTYTCWSWAKIPESGNRIGFVAVEKSVAATAIAAGRLQDWKVGPLHYKFPGDAIPAPTAAVAEPKTRKTKV